MFNPFNRKKQENEEAPLSPEADQFLAEACAEYDPKQEALMKGQWRLESCSEWSMDDEACVVSVFLEDGSQWQADAQMLGTLSPEDTMFQWAWDNPNIGEQLTRDSLLVKEIGQRFGLQYLLMEGGCFPLPDQDFVAYLCGIGIKATNSIGVMESQIEDMCCFLLLKNPRWVTGENQT